MVIRHETTVAIARPAEEVIDFLADMTRQPEYWESVESVRLLAGAHGEPGARYERVIRGLGKLRRTEVEVVERTPGARVVFQGLTPPMRVRATLEARPSGSSTVLRICIEARPEGPFGLLSPLLRIRFVRNTRKSLGRLRSLLEARNHLV